MSIKKLTNSEYYGIKDQAGNDALKKMEELLDTVSDVENSLEDVENSLDAIAPTFNNETAYTSGQFVWYSGILYRFTQDHAAGDWIGTDAEASTVQLDNSLTQSGKAADAKKVGDELADLKSALSTFYITDTSTYINSWEQGYINLSDGTGGGGNDCCRTPDYISFAGGGCKVTVENGYKLYGFEYTAASIDNYVGRVINNGQGTFDYKFTEGRYYKFYIMKTDGSDLPYTSVPATVFGYTMKYKADQSLSVSDFPADAKVTGDKINNLLSVTLFQLSNTVKNITVKQYINTGTGSVGVENARARSEILTTKSIKGIQMTGSVYTMQVLGYDNTGDIYTGTGYTGKLTYTWTNEKVDIPRTIPKIALLIKRLDNADFGDNEASSIIPNIVVYNNTDNSLTRESVPADSKAVGENIYRNFFAASDDISLVSTFNGVIALYDELLSAYPSFVSKNTLTHGSVTNYEYVFTIGNYNSQTGMPFTPDSEKQKPTVMIVSGVHGYEQSSVMGLYSFCKALCENVYSLSKIIDGAIYRVIPIATPWGYDHDTRLNENGVNINRNFASPSWTLTPEGEDYSGASPGDQDETQIIQAWIDEHCTDSIFYIDWHNSEYVSAISCLIGLNTDESKAFKKKYFMGINNIIPYWQRFRKLGTTNIYAYTGNTSTGGTSTSYARYKDMLAFTCETSWNVRSTGKHSNFTIGTNAEAFANMMIAMASYMEDF